MANRTLAIDQRNGAHQLSHSDTLAPYQDQPTSHTLSCCRSIVVNILSEVFCSLIILLSLIKLSLNSLIIIIYFINNILLLLQFIIPNYLDANQYHDPSYKNIIIITNLFIFC